MGNGISTRSAPGTPRVCPDGQVCKHEPNEACLSLCDRTNTRGGPTVAAMTSQQVIEAREASHGSYYHQARTSQELKKAMHDHSRQWAGLSVEQRESLDMIAVKISRILNGNPNEPDHWRDMAGYATLVANTLETGDHLGRVQPKQPAA